MSAVLVEDVKPLLKLDIGCGKRPRDGFEGVDRLDFGQPHTVDVGVQTWPLADNSVAEVHCSHFLEHLPSRQRVYFMNELHRVLVPDGKATIICPHWASNRAYGDMTHCWPPVSEMFFYYLDKKWREENCPHDDIRWNPEGYSCDFLATWGYGLHQGILTKNPEYQQHAITFFKEAAQDIHATLTARK